jgi:coenzyme F420 hydrogenase subunit beta
MSASKISFEESLAANVVDTGKCLGCGACIIVCPFNCLEYLNGKPKLVTECKDCSICAKICPQYDRTLSKLEQFVFGRERKTNEEFGVFRRLALAQTSDSKILSVSQDGGAVTSLLLFALENGIIDSAIVSGASTEKPLLSVPKLATTSKEILECAGTRYFYSPNILALPDAVKQKKRNIAFVGTPCQIRAIRKMQLVGLKKYTDPLKFLIGLMCSECFTYEGLMEKHIRGTLNLNLNEIKKMNIKGKMLVTTESGVQTISLAEAKQYARSNCHFCSDFSSELADISVGGLGLEKWTFTIVRTEKGEELFSSAEKAGVIKTRNVNEEANALNLLRKLSTKKRQISGFI